jgi:TetR/AcrR family transcriptional regulator
MGILERKEREKEHRKEEIIDAAQKVFFERGLFAATMDEIAEAAELSKGTLYLYYKSKEDLYLAVMMRGTQKLSEMFQHVLDSQESVLKKILKLGEAYTEFSQKLQNYFRMFQFFQTPQFHKQVSEEMRETCSLEHKKLWDTFIQLFKDAINEKSIKPELNPRELAIILWSSANALMLRIDNENDIWKERMHIDLTETLQLSNSLLWSAMLTEKGRKELAQITNMKTFT